MLRRSKVMELERDGVKPSSSNSTAAAAPDERGRKRNGVQTEPEMRRPSKWRARGEHQTYSTKLLDAVRLVRAGGTPRPLGVRDAASRALAVAARGRSGAIGSRRDAVGRRRPADEVELPFPVLSPLESIWAR